MTGSYLIDDKEIFQLIDTNVIENALIDKCIELYLSPIKRIIYQVFWMDYISRLVR